jgi:hypothetical protein
VAEIRWSEDIKGVCPIRFQTLFRIRLIYLFDENSAICAIRSFEGDSNCSTTVNEIDEGVRVVSGLETNTRAVVQFELKADNRNAAINSVCNGINTLDRDVEGSVC